VVPSFKVSVLMISSILAGEWCVEWKPSLLSTESVSSF